MIAEGLKGLGYLALMAGCGAFAVGYMIFWMEIVPRLAAAARLAARVARALFLAIGLVIVVVVRLLR